jgi:hypothetical protein
MADPAFGVPHRSAWIIRLFLHRSVLANSLSQELAQSPFFSPDGEWVAFVVTGARSLKKVSVLGGPAVTIAELSDEIPRGLSWGADDTIVFATAGSDEVTPQNLILVQNWDQELKRLVPTN